MIKALHEAVSFFVLLQAETALFMICLVHYVLYNIHMEVFYETC